MNYNQVKAFGMTSSSLFLFVLVPLYLGSLCDQVSVSLRTPNLRSSYNSRLKDVKTYMDTGKYPG